MPLPRTDTATKEHVFEIVRRELARIRRELAPEFDTQIRMDSSLVADLGLDSISMVAAVVAIELALRIDPLSLDAWSEQEAARTEARFTVASLVDMCLERTSAPAVAAFAGHLAARAA
jgi:acyl carrier protein